MASVPNSMAFSTIWRNIFYCARCGAIIEEVFVEFLYLYAGAVEF